jgi:hypothetical protein
MYTHSFSISVVAAWRSETMIVIIPALDAARTPLWESSNARHSAGSSVGLPARLSDQTRFRGTADFRKPSPQACGAADNRSDHVRHRRSFLLQTELLDGLLHLGERLVDDPAQLRGRR